MKKGLLSSLLLVLAVPLAAAAAEPHGFLHAASPGALVAAGQERQAEVVSFDAGLAPQLLRSLPEESLRIADWPVAPGERADVILTRHEVYAPDARVLVVEGEGMREVPRSRLAFFWGAAERDEETRVFVAVDPDSGDMDGFVQAGGATNEIHPLRSVPGISGIPGIPGMKVRAGSREHLIAAAEVFRDQAGETGAWNCGQNDASLDFLDFQREAASPAPRAATANLASLYTATLAIDTDNEFMSIKFADNPTTATNYIASLIAAMTAIYERDLNVRLLQGTVLLRPSTTPDPYTQPVSGNADPTKLNEFSSYWNATYGGVSRTIALLLSGKQPQPPTGSGGASGIAWIHGLCSKSVGYSVNQVIVPGTSPTSADVQVVAHEVGHNFGSPHTHCYKTNGVLDPVDFCYMGEGGCYSGATSCPAPQTINGVTNVTGTLMSYCHVPAKSGGVDGCSVKTVFHPRTVAFVQTDLNAAVNVCLFPALPPPTVTAASPDSGTTLGGTPVTITGTGFQAGATVTFGGTAATGVNVTNATTITATAPAHAAGGVTVAVNNPDAQSGSKASAFTYIALPAISSVAPSSGPTAGGTAVTIHGSNFQNGITVTIGGSPATSVVFVNATTVTAVTPAHATGTAAVIVTNPDTHVAYLVNGFFYAPAAVETDFYSVEPCRLVDTRDPDGPLGGPTLAAGQSRVFTVAGTCNVPAGAKSIAVNITVIAPALGGNLSAYPGNAFALGTSALNFAPGVTRANNAILLLSTDGNGTLGIQNGSSGLTDVTIDVDGYFQ